MTQAPRRPVSVPRGFVVLAALALLCALLAVGARPAHAANFAVNSTGDDGDQNTTNGVCDTGVLIFPTGEPVCTLRAAIQQANATSGADTISFNIPGGGVKTISPTSELPEITSPATIDGTTQSGYGGTPVIELNGAAAGTGASGLTISAGNSTVKGLAINRFPFYGILLKTNGLNTVIGNHIGTDPSGTSITDSSGNSLGNGRGIQVHTSNDNQIGGMTAGESNVISGNGSSGVRLDFTNRTVVRGNYIGTDKNGSTDLGNASSGVLLINASSSTIGGTAPGAGNTIAFNGEGGVVVLSNGLDPILSNSIFSNDGLGIELDVGGFPLDSVTPNDPGDGDHGANGLQNFPELTSASHSGGTTTIKGKLNSTPNTTFTIQLFSSPEAHSSGNGEGKKYLDQQNVTTDSSGNASFTFSTTNAQADEVFTATATSVDGGNGSHLNTSEFSKAIEVDTTAPTVDVSPADGRTGIRRSANVTATFSEAMDPETLVTSPTDPANPNAGTSTTFTLTRAGASKPLPAKATVSADGKKATLDPLVKLGERKKYTVKITGAKDLAGNALPDKTWSFKTGRK